MNYLQLCQMVASESGTISGDNTPTTTVGQSGRLLKVVSWTSKSWVRLQNLFPDWLWMRDEFTGNLTQGNAKYTGASFGLTRWGQWITAPHSMTLYDAALGVADEGEISFMPWDAYRRYFGRGLQVQNRPRFYSISPKGELCFGSIPDKAYVARGEYQKNAQVLGTTADPNNEVPELPDANLHSVIAWNALLLLAQYDEDQWETSVASVRCGDDLNSMQKYRPKPEIGAGSCIA